MATVTSVGDGESHEYTLASDPAAGDVVVQEHLVGGVNGPRVSPVCQTRKPLWRLDLEANSAAETPGPYHLSCK